MELKKVLTSLQVADPHKESEEHSSMDNADILFSDMSSGQKDNSASSTGELFKFVLGYLGLIFLLKLNIKRYLLVFQNQLVMT